MSVDLCMSSESESIMSRLGQSDWQESVAFKQSWHQHHLDPANGLTFWPDAINWYEASSSLLSLRSLGPRGAGSTWALGGPSKNLLQLWRWWCVCDVKTITENEDDEDYGDDLNVRYNQIYFWVAHGQWGCSACVKVLNWGLGPHEDQLAEMVLI